MKSFTCSQCGRVNTRAEIEERQGGPHSSEQLACLEILNQWRASIAKDSKDNTKMSHHKKKSAMKKQVEKDIQNAVNKTPPRQPITSSSLGIGYIYESFATWLDDARVPTKRDCHIWLGDYGDEFMLDLMPRLVWLCREHARANGFKLHGLTDEAQ